MLKKTEQNDFYIKLGQNIRAIREDKKMKQETLASHVGFTRVSISNIETGKQKIQLHTLIELSNYLNIPVQELIPSIEIVKSEVSLKLEKKIFTAEISNNAQAMEKAKAFIKFSSIKSGHHVSRQSLFAKNRKKSK